MTTTTRGDAERDGVARTLDRGVFAGERGCDENGAGEIRGVEQSVERGVRERGNGERAVSIDDETRDDVRFRALRFGDGRGRRARGRVWTE